MDKWKPVCDGCHKELANWPNGQMVEAAGRLHLDASPVCETVTIGYELKPRVKA